MTDTNTASDQSASLERHITSEGDRKKMQYLTFFLNDEEYGIDILSVREICVWEDPTPIPHSPNFMKGVINLRGTVIPVVDLRTRFFLPPMDANLGSSVVVVLQVTTSTGLKIVGLAVDRVSDVYTMHEGSLKEPPSIGTAVSPELLRGIVTVDEKMVIILNEVRFLEFE